MDTRIVALADLEPLVAGENRQVQQGITSVAVVFVELAEALGWAEAIPVKMSAAAMANAVERQGAALKSNLLIIEVESP